MIVFLVKCVKLFTVGPVACYPEVLKVMGTQMYSHRSSEYLKLHYDTVDRLQNILETTNSIYLFSSTGTGFMEAAVRNCIKKKILVCVNGSFGKRFVDVANANGKETILIEPPLGVPITSNMVSEKLEINPEIEAVAITHNETSVGLINPLEELSRTVKHYDKLLFVDAVSSMGGTAINVDKWGIDICYSSSQKCFGVPPGLGIGSVSQNALEASNKAVDKGWYFDLAIWEKHHKEGKGTPMTSTIPQVAGLNAALKFIDENGGKNWFFNLYKERNRVIRKGISEIGITTYPQIGYESPTVNCINSPDGIKGEIIYKAMREKGYELAQGYGELKDSTFRIGNMGYIEEGSIDSMLTSLREVINSF